MKTLLYLHLCAKSLAVSALAWACACGDGLQVQTPGVSGSESQNFRDERSGVRVNTVWVLDASSLQKDQEALRRKLFELASTFPLPRTSRGHHAVILARAGALTNQVESAGCPAPRALWNYSQVCGEPSDPLSLSQFLHCALDGTTAHRTALPPVSALASFLQEGIETDAFLHIVVVSHADDDGFESVSESARVVFANRRDFPQRALVTVIGPATAPPEAESSENRLAMFANAFGENGQYIDVEDDPWPSFTQSIYHLLWSNETCLSPEMVATLEDSVRGNNCIVEERIYRPEGDTARVVPSCATHPTFPCWVLNTKGCPDISISRGNCLPHEGTLIRIVCGRVVPNASAVSSSRMAG